MSTTHTQMPNTDGRYIVIAVILFIILMMILPSCSSQQRLARKQAKYCNDIVNIDSVVTIQTDTVTKESIRIVKSAPNPDTLLLFAQAYCDSNNQVQMPIIIYRNKDNQAQIGINNNQLQARVICNTDSIEQVVKEKETQIKYLKTHKEIKTVLRYKIVDKFYKWFFWIVVIVFVISVATLIAWRHFFK